MPAGGQPGGAERHPAATPYDVAAWRCRYILPADGVLLDPSCGSGTILQAGLDQAANEVIGVEKGEEVPGDCEAANHLNGRGTFRTTGRYIYSDNYFSGLTTIRIPG